MESCRIISQYALDNLDNMQILLTYGFQAFPTNKNEINLSNILWLKEKFGLNVGYADHTIFEDEYMDNLVEYAYIMGCRVFEKHITLKKGENRIDYESAVEYTDIINLKKRLDQLIKILGGGDAYVNQKIIGYKNREKQLVYTKNISKGEKITLKSIGFKISNKTSDFEQREIGQVIGKIASKDLLKDECIKKNDFKGF